MSGRTSGLNSGVTTQPSPGTQSNRRTTWQK
ncbi:hypothetical protein WP1_135 [Pseudomonas phage WP1]